MSKKLVLNKETLRHLGDNELKQVVGGTFDFFTLPFAASPWLWQHLFQKKQDTAAVQGGNPPTTWDPQGCVTVPTTGTG